MANSMADVMVAGSAGVVAQRSRFFLVMAIVLFVPVAIGFGPTFFLRPWSGARDPLGGPFPVHLIIHGSVLSAWFLLFIAQPTLVASHRVDLHRRLGVFGVGLAVAVVIASIVTLVRVVPRGMAAGAPMDAIMGVVVGDSGALVAFALCVGSAVYMRRRPAVHARLMLLASTFIVGPAFSTRPPRGFSLLPGVSETTPIGLWFMLACIGALVAYDVATLRRIHRATLYGIAVLFAAGTAVGAVFYFSGLGAALQSPR
jgi:hypothetical protein